MTRRIRKERFAYNIMLDEGEGEFPLCCVLNDIDRARSVMRDLFFDNLKEWLYNYDLNYPVEEYFDIELTPNRFTATSDDGEVIETFIESVMIL